MSGVLELSELECLRLGVLSRVVLGGLPLGAASLELGVGVRQVKRLVRAFRAHGASGLVSKRRGVRSNNRLADEVRARVIGLLGDKYLDFGPTLAAEKLLALEGIKISRETVRGLQIELGLHRAKVRRRKRVFALRERRPRCGELIQIDGSPHDWFEGRAARCTLIVFIDDATGALMGLRFAPAETVRDYLLVLEGYVHAHGVPLAFYSDRHGIFRVNAKEAATGDGKTVFGRAVERLSIELIHATTPQAKGRVERANQTLQDRLVREMRLRDISSIEAAHAFLPGFIADWNARFAVPPADPEDAHRPWTGTGADLAEALARREERTLSKALTFSTGGVIHCVKTKGFGTALRGAKVTLLHMLDGSMRVTYRGRTLETTIFKTRGAPAPLEDGKTIDSRMCAIIAASQQISANLTGLKLPHRG